MPKKGKKKSGKKAEQKLIDDAFREKLAGILAQTAEEKATETKDSPLGAAYRRGPVLMRGSMIPGPPPVITATPWFARRAPVKTASS